MTLTGWIRHVGTTLRLVNASGLLLIRLGIPSDHVQRKEAIRGINSVFFGSSATLVCDRDLMEIDAEGLEFDTDLPSQNTVRRAEEILACILVCDWNVRAWSKR